MESAKGRFRPPHNAAEAATRPRKSPGTELRAPCPMPHGLCIIGMSGNGAEGALGVRQLAAAFQSASLLARHGRASSMDRALIRMGSHDGFGRQQAAAKEGASKLAHSKGAFGAMA